MYAHREMEFQVLKMKKYAPHKLLASDGYLKLLAGNNIVEKAWPICKMLIYTLKINTGLEISLILLTDLEERLSAK